MKTREKEYKSILGPIEQNAKQKRRRQNVSQVLLAGLGTIGLLAVSAPNAVQLLRFFPGMNSRKGYSALRAFHRLLAQGHIEFVGKKGKQYASLTEKGRQRLRLYHDHGAMAGKIWRRWDGQWRMVVYDIPEKRRSTRVALLAVLRRHDFYKLQASVWVYPYDCEELITLIKADIGEGKGVVYGVVSALENDKKIREYFKLPLDR
jgi:DNA-binding transcriptional regulator PaaX